MATTGIKAKILTGVPPYNQDDVVKENGKSLIAGCGPVAALMLLAYYDARFGYKRLVGAGAEADLGMPDELILELRRKMHTVNDLKNGQVWGMTLPPFFHSGLDAYITDRYGKTVIKEFGTNIFGRVLDEVFEKSRELIDDGKPHAFLFDWKGDTGVFPNHYVVIVGYRRDGGRKHLIANAGWGTASQFLTIDMEDKDVKPASLYYIESISDKPEGPADGHRIGPSPNYNWSTGSGARKLEPTVRKHFSSSTETWEPCDSTRELFPGKDYAVCAWE